MTDDVLRGSCLCGQVRFQVSGRHRKIYQCHCSLCRKQSGSSSNAALVVSVDDFTWTSGQERILSYVRPTGFRADSCRGCGSPVPNRLRTTTHVWVPAGLLDDDVQLEIAMHLFVGSKARWDQVPSHGAHHETMPALAAFIALMR